MASDKQKALTALTLLRATCSDALTLLSDGDGPVQKPDEQPTLVIIQKDLSSLLSLIYEAATKLALSLKPSSPTYSASLTPIREISERVAAVAHCVLFIDPNLHGATLFKEAVETVKDVIEATSSLADAFLAAASTPNPRDEYLSRTGTVHELAEKAKNLSLSNVLAVQKRWKQDRASLDDAVSELHDMLEQAEADDGAEQLDADFDDGWAEFGIGSDKKLEVDELARAKKAYTFLRYTSLLHKRVLQDILTTQESNTDNPSPSVYDGMCNASATLLICADDFVAALYGPHEPTHIKEELDTLLGIVNILCGIIKENFLPVGQQLSAQLEQLSLSQPTTSAPQKLAHSSAKWFRTCFEQLDKSIQALRNDLDPNLPHA
ncbi:hypothetical protein BDN71DRAFT_1439738 [Pleurotus eryngii]|uniref:Uncharacterized protein n=1 Tax=Pleurotus eryngii TaxID=5323 RepID=A0A9P6DBU8_PLEER|nr:hypothetical protein BDN71DRAFT_1439738 [Pleurotus eryngii]